MYCIHNHTITPPCHQSHGQDIQTGESAEVIPQRQTLRQEHDSIYSHVEREEWIDMAKVLTMLLVIIGHSAYYSIKTSFGGIDFFSDFESSEICISRKIIRVMIGFIYSFHMPFFMALSGMTYAISFKPQTTYRSFVRKKALRLLLPFLMVTIFLSIPMKGIGGYWSHSSDIILNIFIGQFLLFGNSHLWFVASLFLITVIFNWLHRKSLVKVKSPIFWILCIIGCYVGKRLEYYGCFLGIPGALKLFGFFALGFATFNSCKRVSIRTPLLILSWILMALLYLIKIHIGNAYHLSTLLFIPLAAWGCFNMVLTAKVILSKTQFHTWSVYESFRKNSYELYLYSDPFNYALIALLISLFGDSIMTADHVSVLAFATRIIATILLSYAVMFLINKLFSPVMQGIRRKMRIA